MSRVLFVLALVGCSYDSSAPIEQKEEAAPVVVDDGSAAEEQESGGNQELASCFGGELGPVPGYESYRLSEVTLPSGQVDAVNWAYRESATVAVNVDLASFVAAGFSEGEVLESLGYAMHFWNGAAADINLVLGDTDIDCCPAEGGEDCDACDTGGEVYLQMMAAADTRGIPAYTRSSYGDDPSTSSPEASCLEAAEVRFFPAGLAADGSAVAYDWVARGADVQDSDPADGSLEKPFYDTLVHELGHTLGLGDQPDASEQCSVMAHCGDAGCACDYDTIPEADKAALTHVYAPR